MAQTATARRASKVAQPAVRVPIVWELHLDKTAGTLMDTLAAARQLRLEGERAENPLKAALKAIFEPECEDLEQGDILQLFVDKELRGTVSRVPGQPKIDMDLLLAAYPEAYEQCVSPADHLRFNPA